MGTRDGYPLGTFCWVDLATSDAVAAKRLYAHLLGWEAPGGAAYAHCSTGGHDVAAVYERDGVAPQWTSYVAVDDADAVAARAVELGATVVEPPFRRCRGAPGGGRRSGRSAVRALAGRDAPWRGARQRRRLLVLEPAPGA